MRYRTKTWAVQNQELKTLWEQKYRDWHKYFAWFPIKVATTDDYHTFVWLGYVERSYPHFNAFQGRLRCPKYREVQ